MYTPTRTGGHAQYTRELLRALTRISESVELVTSEDLDPCFRGSEYPVHQILPPLRHRSHFRSRLGWAANRLSHYPRCERQFLQWLRGRPDIGAVHFQEHTSWRAPRFFGAVKASGRSVFYTVHNVRPHAYPPFVPPHQVDRWDRAAYRMCDGLFVLSPRLKDELSKFLGEPHPPIHVAPHGVWSVPERFHAPSMVDRMRLKRLLFFGNIRRNKGLDILLHAAGQMPDFGLTIAGEPREREYFESEVRPLVRRLCASGSRIDLIDRFIGDDELAELFAGHSAVVLPYTPGFTAQSGVVFLALAYDVPVVASKAGGLADLFDEFRVGSTFAADDARDLARAVRELHAEDRSEQLAGEIRAAKRRYSWDESARQTARAYGWAAQPMRACA